MTHLLNRRQFVATTAGVLSSASISHSLLGAPLAKVSERRVISQREEVYHGWPTLARRSNGDLLLVWSGARESHVCPFGAVEWMVSTDAGKNWSWPRTLLDGPIDDRDAGVLETAKGTLLVTTFTSLAYEGALKNMEAAAQREGRVSERLGRWRAVQRRLSAKRRQSELGVWMIRSEDGGATWSSRYRCQVNSPHGPIQLADGRLLYAGIELWTGERKIGVCESRDDGKTWDWLSAIPTRKGDDPSQYHELHAVEGQPGQIVVHIRNHNKRNNRETLQVESSDGGKTWTEPHSIGVWGLPSHLLKLSDDRLLMSYGHRRPPFGNQARISNDGGKSWSEAIAISDDATNGDLGYPSTVETSPGRLLTVWYEKQADAPRAVLRQAAWTVS